MKLANSLRLSFLMLVVVGGTVGFTHVKAGWNAEALDPLPRELEVHWALSAIPPYLRSVLPAKGSPSFGRTANK